MKLSRQLTAGFGIILLLAVWEANSRLGIYRLLAPSLPPGAFPTIVTIVGELGRLTFSQITWDALTITIAKTLCAFAFSLVLGVLLGLVAGRSIVVDAITRWPVEFFRNIPAIAVFPVLIILFGIGGAMTISLAVFGALFPVFIATRSAIQNISQELYIAAQFYRWRGLSLVFLVLLPAALPEIVAASQTALSIALILIIMGEMLVGSSGLGALIVDAERSFQYAELYALILALGVVGTSLALAFRGVATWLVFWRTALDWR